MDFSLDSVWQYIFIFLVGSFIFSYIYEKKRTEALLLIAKKLGFTFSKSGRETTKSKHENFELFSKGQSREFKNEIWGDDKENNVSIFGYCYTEGHGKNSTTYNQTVLSIECSNLKSPHFQLKPENAFHKIGQVFGYQDIDFELYPTFSKTYLLRGNDEMKIREFFTPKAIKFFELNQGIYIEAQGNILIFYKPSKRCKPNEIKALYRDGQAVLSNLL